jgi:hypothetical protein
MCPDGGLNAQHQACMLVIEVCWVFIMHFEGECIKNAGLCMVGLLNALIHEDQPSIPTRSSLLPCYDVSELAERSKGRTPVAPRQKVERIIEYIVSHALVPLLYMHSVYDNG